MGWFRRFFKDSNKKISKGRYRRRHELGTIDSYQSNSRNARFENEDTTSSIAPSLLKEDEKGKDVIVDVESLSKGCELPISSSSSSTNRICVGCNRDIDHERSLSCASATWHANCLKCHECNRLIFDSEFSMSGTSPYHKACYQEHFFPKCAVCTKSIPITSCSLHAYWDQKCCTTHWSDQTPHCISCDRLIELVEAKYVGFDDGRKLCLECMETAIMDNDEFERVYVDVQEFYRRLGMKIVEEFPIILVDLKEMNEAMKGEKISHNGEYEIIRGLCLSEKQTVQQVKRRPRIRAGNQVTDVTTEPYKLTSNYDVTAILILYGLPRLLTGSILAHEMMHAWLRLNGYGNLAEDVVEGICQVFAHMWLECQITVMSKSNSSFEKKVGEFYKNNIETHTIPAYRDGFRAGKEAVDKHGLQETLQHIWTTGKFPP